MAICGPGPIRFQDSLERLHYRQDNDQDHERRRDLVQDSIKASWPLIGVLRERAHASGKIAVQSAKTKNQDEFCLPPAIPPIAGQVNEDETGKKDENHRRVD